MQEVFPLRKELEAARISVQDSMKAMEVANSTLDLQMLEAAKQRRQHEVSGHTVWDVSCFMLLAALYCILPYCGNVCIPYIFP